MRISTRQTFLNSVSNMQNSQSKLADLQNQLSTGKKLNKPSDDPVAAAQVVKLNRELAQTEKFQDNIDVTQRRLELEETVLDNLNNATIRIRELTIQAGNGSLGDADRKTIATEIRGLVEYSAGLMNTQDAQGEYLFAGSRGFDQPYVLGPAGSYSYAGDDGQRLIQVAPELFVPSSDSGEYLFEAASESLAVGLLPAGQGFIADLEVANEETFAAFAKGKGDLQLEVQLDTTSVTPAWQYQFRDSDGAVVEGPTALPDIATGETVEIHGLKFTLTEPAASDLVIEQQVSGIKTLTVADPVAANALHTAVGDITITFDATNSQFDLTDGAGDPVTVDGQSNPFSYTNDTDQVIGGFRLDIGTPEDGETLTFGLPLTAISPVTDVQVSDVTEYAAAANAYGELEVQFTSATTYNLVDSGGTTILVGGDFSGTPTSVALEAPALTSLGITLTVDNPVAGDIVKLKVPAGTETTMRPEEQKQNILDVALELVEVLEQPVESGTQRTELQDALSGTLDKLKQVEERNLEARTAIGARINSLDNTKTSNEDFKLFTQTALSSLEDVDFAEAISELKLEEAVLQAAQASFVRIQELSLFNFIR
ncbi:MAG: flagellar hook-associated protein FlgL [Oceanospirillaceae bacterium]|nr:flagellar hook-associated protein FlgL [Oceanospirillaceae bacterium]